MLENQTFYAEAMSILEIVMEAAVDFTSRLNTPRSESPVDLSDILQRLAKEAARQINTLFIRITAPMWNENNSLKIKVKQLDTDVKTTEQHLDVAQKWRDSVLRGSPVLFEQSGQIFILTPFEKLKNDKHKRTAGSVHATLPTVQSAASHPRPSMAPMVVVNKVPSVPTLLLAEGGRVVPKAPALPAAMTTPVTTPLGAKKPRGKNTSKRGRTEREKLVRGPAEMQRTHKWQECKAARRFFCKVCSAGFHWRADLLSHTKVHVKLQQEKKMYRPQTPPLQTALVMKPRLDKDVSESEVIAAGDSDTADLSKRHERNQKNRALRTVKRFFCSICHVGFHWQADLHRHAKVHKKPFQCPHCPRGYLTETLLENHVLRHHRLQQPLPFGCDRCGRKFRLQSSLQRHLARHETGGQPAVAPLACSRCGKLFKGEVALQNHLRRHEADTEGFQCQVCGKAFRTAALARCHRVVHSEERPFKCPLCARAFKSRSCLRFHQTVHSDRRRHRCGMCDRSFRYAYSLTVHVRGHTGEAPYGCDVCGKSFTAAASLRKHRVVHTGEKPFTCHVCGAMFGLGANLRRHLRIHTGEKPYGCTDCHERFADSNRLKAHMLLHGATKQFMCDLCGKTFLFNCKLLKHQEAAHNGQRTSESAGEGRAWRKTPTNPFRCGICLKGFASASYLRIHEKAHDGQRPYGCGICNKSFSNKYALGSHEKTHSDEKPYGCGACGKSFKAASSLRLHERTHNGEKPYGCEQCGKAFSCSGNLQRHQKVHTGEKPYECEQCHRRFSQSNQIKLHMQIHTGVKLYQCDKCGRGFSDSRQYKKHGCQFNVAAMQ